MQRIIDSLFNPIIQVLTQARDYLENASKISAKGLNLDYFLGPVSMLGWQWRSLILSVISSVILIVTILAVRKLYGLYLAMKEGAKWW